MFVLVRTDGKYVAPPGNEKSYVTRLEDARVFPTRESAEKERCVESERIAAVADLFRIA
jgi:hypothetical protein